jgi:HEPN domain-containing protein
MPDKAKELVALWLQLVDTDVGAAERLLPDLVDPAAFHVQQAIEKALKAAIVLDGHEPPKIHDLNRLHAAIKGRLRWGETDAWLAQKTEWNAVMRYRLTDMSEKPSPEDVIEALDSLRHLVAELRAKVS